MLSTKYVDLICIGVAAYNSALLISRTMQPYLGFWQWLLCSFVLIKTIILAGALIYFAETSTPNIRFHQVKVATGVLLGITGVSLSWL